MPLALTSSSGTLCRSTSKPSPSRSLATTSADRAQSPGGLSDGIFTISPRKRVSASACSRTKSWIALSAGVIASPFFERHGLEVLDAHPVISRRHMWRQACPQGLVVEVGMQVGQDRAARTHPLDPVKRIVEAEMGRMGAIAQRVDDPQVQALEEGKARVRYLFYVRRVSERAEPEAERADLAVV